MVTNEPNVTYAVFFACCFCSYCCCYRCCPLFVLLICSAFEHFTTRIPHSHALHVYIWYVCIIWHYTIAHHAVRVNADYACECTLIRFHHLPYVREHKMWDFHIEFISRAIQTRFCEQNKKHPTLISFENTNNIWLVHWSVGFNIEN